MDMIKDLGEKIPDVVVREGVVDVLAFANTRDEPGAGELLQPLRHR
jgi:hypothetical protein